MRVIAAAALAPGVPSLDTPLALTHPGVPARAVGELGEAVPLRARKTMARGALLATTAMADLVQRLPFVDGVGCFLGVGASAGAMPDLHAMLAAAIETGGAWSLARFGGAGLAACNPLLAFQLMNNFTMCHAAIHAGVTGPNGAYFSRGAGTVAALAAAVNSVRDGDCEIAIAGGADSALHPVTWAEMVRDRQGHRVPSEGAGLIAIAREGDAIARITIGGARGAEVIDGLALFGEALAATPALAWVAGLARIAAGVPRVVVVTPDADTVTLEAP